MDKILYNIFTASYPLLLRLISPFNKKAAKWVEGRKNWQAIASPFSNTDKVIWFHAASVGEFEQGRPLIDAIKEKYPEHKIVLTFFSPSGYEAKKNYSNADLIMYLPMDSAQNARLFIERYRPIAAFFIKYEFWFYYLTELEKKNIPAFLVSAVFRRDQPFFKWYGDLFKKMLHSYDHIFLQHEDPAELLRTINVFHYTVTGDTRFDRVHSIAKAFTPIDPLEKLKAGQMIVAGSTWKNDDEILSHFLRNNSAIKCIVAPHDVSPKRICECKDLYPSTILFSAITQYAGEQVIIIDNIGLLSRLYHYATIAYVGGGFTNDGIHNTLEAAVHGVPVIFGPEYSKYQEAKELITNNAAISINDQVSLNEVLEKLLTDEALLKKMGSNAAGYVEKNTGATEKILANPQLKRLFTS